MSNDDKVTSYVLAPEDIVWNKLEKPGFPGLEFWFSESVIDDDYATLFSAQLGKIGPGGKSRPHRDPYNHAFYFTSGTGSVQIGRQTWDITPGTVVKIPEGKPHSITNTGTEDLAFIVIYDPPYVAGAVPNKPIDDEAV